MIITNKNILDFEKLYRTNFVNSLSGFKSANLIGTVAICGFASYHETKRIARLSYSKPGSEPKEF